MGWDEVENRIQSEFGWEPKISLDSLEFDAVIIKVFGYDVVDVQFSKADQIAAVKTFLCMCSPNRNSRLGRHNEFGHAQSLHNRDGGRGLRRCLVELWP